MIKFEASNPFPLVTPGACSEREARLHAAEVDRWLGFRIQPIEEALASKGCRLRAPDAGGERQELWFGLDAQMLLTPYIELRQLLETIAPRAGQTVVDLGAAYGRMGFVMCRHFPESRFIGYEYVGERVEEARRCLKKFASRATVAIEHADLANTEFEPVAADFYFIYDYGTPKAIEKTLHDLRRQACVAPITVIVRGRHARYMIETRHQWLRSQKSERGEARASIYASDPSLVQSLDLDQSA